MKRNQPAMIPGFGFGQNVPPSLDICPPLMPQEFSNVVDETPDLLVLAEFNEIEGPAPIMMIPKEGIPGMNVSDFVVKLLSTDYQNAGCGEFEITRDTSLLQHDDKYNLFFYVHYFTLFDTRARGFVRPMCVAYVSKSKKKLMTYHKSLAEEFRKAIEYLRVANLHCFAKESEDRIADLQYTKECFLQFQTDTQQLNKATSSDDQIDNATGPDEIKDRLPIHHQNLTTIGGKLSPISPPSHSQLENQFSSSPIEDKNAMRVSAVMFDNSMDEDSVCHKEKLCVLNHTNLDSLASQTLDCKNGLEVILEYLDSSSVTQELEEIEQYLKDTYHCPLYAIARDYFKAAPLGGTSPHVPSIFVLALMRRSSNNMRNVKALCGVGYIAFVSRALEVYKRFSKSLTTLFFDELDADMAEDPLGSLFAGRVPMVHLTKVLIKKPEERTVRSMFEDDGLLELLKQGDPNLTADSSLTRSGGADRDCLDAFKPASVVQQDTQKSKLNKSPPMERDSDENISDLSENISNLSIQVELENYYTNNNESKASSSNLNNETFYNICQRMNEHQMWGLVKKFSEVCQCIINSVLSGRPLIVSGPASMKSTVKSYIDGLTTILPVHPSTSNPVLRWHTGTVTEHHLRLYKIVGLCIPERLHAQDLLSNASLNKVTLINVETGHISGVAYGGRLLNKIESLCNKIVQSPNDPKREQKDGTLQTFLQAIIVTHGSQVFLLHHLLKVTNKTPDEVLKGIGVARRDWESVKYLNQIVNDQETKYNLERNF